MELLLQGTLNHVQLSINDFYRSIYNAKAVGRFSERLGEELIVDFFDEVLLGVIAFELTGRKLYRRVQIPQRRIVDILRKSCLIERIQRAIETLNDRITFKHFTIGKQCFENGLGNLMLCQNRNGISLRIPGIQRITKTLHELHEWAMGFIAINKLSNLSSTVTGDIGNIISPFAPINLGSALTDYLRIDAFGEFSHFQIKFRLGCGTAAIILTGSIFTIIAATISMFIWVRITNMSTFRLFRFALFQLRLVKNFNLNNLAQRIGITKCCCIDDGI